MMENKWSVTLIAVSLMVLIGSAAGCISVVREGAAPPPTSAPQEPTAPPVISSFTASQLSISPAQQTTLSWDVSGATTRTIQPEIGTVGPSGSLQLSPPATVTYTLTATNQAGSTTGSVTITVVPTTAKPDLVITDIWLESEVIYYKIRNQGSADAKSIRSELQVNNRREATDYVDSVPAGQEKTESFSNWAWRFPLPVSGPLSQAEFYTTKVCADAENTIGEIDEGNNCKTWQLGPGYTYDFVLQAHLAKWQSAATVLIWPMFPGNKQGTAYLMTDTIVMCPEQVSNGWIQGRFADYYFDTGSRTTRSRLIVIPDNVKFIAKVGFQRDTTSTDGARVAFGYVDDMGNVALLDKMDIYSDGKLYDYEVDLSQLAGKKTEFILWVEAKDLAEGDCVRWVEPKIVQE